MPRAVQPDLLLDRGDRRRRRAVEPAALVAAARDLERDVGAEPVVHRARDEPVAGERAPARRAITTGSPIRTSSSASSRSAAPMSMCRPVELDRLLALLVLEQVDRLAADDAGHGAVARSGPRPAGRPGSARPSRRSAVKQSEALLVDVGDREPDLVDVADDASSGASSASPTRAIEEPMPVGLELGERGGVAPHLRRRRLVARGRGVRRSLSRSSGTSAIAATP